MSNTISKSVDMKLCLIGQNKMLIGCLLVSNQYVETLLLKYLNFLVYFLHGLKFYEGNQTKKR